MNIKLVAIVAIIVTLTTEPNEDKLNALRGQAESTYRYDNHVSEDGLVFSAQTLTEIASNYYQVETLVGVPA